MTLRDRGNDDRQHRQAPQPPEPRRQLRRRPRQQRAQHHRDHEGAERELRGRQQRPRRFREHRTRSGTPAHRPRGPWSAAGSAAAPPGRPAPPTKPTTPTIGSQRRALEPVRGFATDAMTAMAQAPTGLALGGGRGPALGRHVEQLRVARPETDRDRLADARACGSSCPGLPRAHVRARASRPRWRRRRSVARRTRRRGPSRHERHAGLGCLAGRSDAEVFGPQAGRPPGRPCPSARASRPRGADRCSSSHPRPARTPAGSPCR